MSASTISCIKPNEGVNMKPFTVLICAPWWPAGPIRYLGEAFERIGCQVIRIGASYSDHMGLQWGKDTELPIIHWELPREKPQWNLNEFIDWTTKNYQAPDLLIISEENYQTNMVPTTKIPSILWSFDGWPNNFERIEMVKPTLGYINHPYGIRIHPRVEEDSRWRFMPGAAAPWVHKWLNLERDWEFVLLASMYGKRQQICDDLQKNGVTVWCGQATTNTYVEAYNRALTTYHNCNGQQEIKWRFFESAVMGTCVMSGYTVLLPRLGYLPWEHYIPLIEYVDSKFNGELWPDTDEICKKIRWLQNNNEIVMGVTGNVRVHTLRNHTYLHRVRTMLTDLNYIDNKRLIEKTDDAIGVMIKEAGLVPC